MKFIFLTITNLFILIRKLAVDDIEKWFRLEVRDKEKGGKRKGRGLRKRKRKGAVERDENMENVEIKER